MWTNQVTLVCTAGALVPRDESQVRQRPISAQTFNHDVDFWSHSGHSELAVRVFVGINAVFQSVSVTGSGRGEIDRFEPTRRRCRHLLGVGCGRSRVLRTRTPAAAD